MFDIKVPVSAHVRVSVAHVVAIDAHVSELAALAVFAIVPELGFAVLVIVMAS
jgi:hypothetical protein